LSEAKEQVNLHWQEAQNARSAFNALESKTQKEVNELSKMAAEFKSQAYESSKRLAAVEAQGFHLARSSTQGANQASVSELQRQLEHEKRECSRFQENLQKLQTKYKALESHLDNPAKEQSEFDAVALATPIVVRQYPDLLHFVAAAGWVVSIFLFLFFSFRVEDQSTLQVLRKSLEDKELLHAKEVRRLSSSVNQLEQQLDAARQSKSQALLELEKLRAAPRVASTSNPQMPDPKNKNLARQTAPRNGGSFLPDKSQSSQTNGKNTNNTVGGMDQDNR
jgi:chromosome segregation ATPase